MLAATIFSISAYAQGGELEDYIANPPAIQKASWGKKDAPSVRIPLYQKRFLDAATDDEKGIAVANLALIARRMSHHALARPAARELLEEWVMPNLKYTEEFRSSSGCSWRNTMLHCLTAYEAMKDREKERECMKMVYSANRRDGDRDLMVYLLAYQNARYGDYQEAIKTLESLDEESKWAPHRKKLKRMWTKHHDKQVKELLKYE